MSADPTLQPTITERDIRLNLVRHAFIAAIACIMAASAVVLCSREIDTSGYGKAYALGIVLMAICAQGLAAQCIRLLLAAARYRVAKG